MQCKHASIITQSNLFHWNDEANHSHSSALILYWLRCYWIVAHCHCCLFFSYSLNIGYVCIHAAGDLVWYERGSHFSADGKRGRSGSERCFQHQQADRRGCSEPCPGSRGHSLLPRKCYYTFLLDLLLSIVIPEVIGIKTHLQNEYVILILIVYLFIYLCNSNYYLII